MANPAHLDVLSKGVSFWNNWRKTNPEVVPDLSGTDFSGRNLAQVNFSKANLNNAVFTGADLTGADLTGASISETMGLAWQGKQF
jgi:hypothetical protein